MFYRTDEPHGLPHNPFNSLVVPRPIGWISSLDADGNANIAPYSFFNAVSYTPPQVMFSSGPPPPPKRDGSPAKDSLANIQATGEFVVNLATWDLREQMNATSAEASREVDEFALAGLTKSKAELVAPPRVAESPVHLECRYLQSVTLKAREGHAPNVITIGEVIGIHIADAVLTDGMVDMSKLQPIGRLGYMDYCRVREVFTMPRPRWP